MNLRTSPRSAERTKGAAPCRLNVSLRIDKGSIRMARGVPDSGWAWIIVLGVAIINVSILPVQQCFGLIFGERFDSLGISATQTSLILHLNGTITCSLGLISGPMMKRFTFRQVAFFGVLIVAIGIWATAFSVSLTTIILSYCVIISIGQGIIYPATTLAMNTYFRKKRSMAMGFTVTMTGLGPIVMPLLIVTLLENYATTGTLIVLAGIASNAFIGASLLKPFTQQKVVCHARQSTNTDKPQLPCDNGGDNQQTVQNHEDKEDIENGATERRLMQPEHTSKRSQKSDEAINASQKEKREKYEKQTIYQKIASNLDLDLLKDNRYVAVVLGMGISLVAETNFNAMVPFVLTELSGLSRGSVATVMSTQAAFDIAGRLCVPLVAQKARWTSRNLYVISLLGFTLGRTILSTWGEHYWVVIGVSVIVGISKGTKAVFQALIIPDFVSLDRLPGASGIQMVCNGILSIAVGPLIGLVHDSTGSYVGALYFTSALSLSCVLLWIIGGLWSLPCGRNIEPLSKKTQSLEAQDEAIEAR